MLNAYIINNFKIITRPSTIPHRNIYKYIYKPILNSNNFTYLLVCGILEILVMFIIIFDFLWCECELRIYVIIMPIVIFLILLARDAKTMMTTINIGGYEDGNEVQIGHWYR